MLFDFVKKFAKGFVKKPIRSSVDADALLREAKKAEEDHDLRTAERLLREYLQIRPHDVDAMNDLACCLGATGREEQAREIFEKAFALNDTYMPVVINYAGVLKDKGAAADGLKMVERAQHQTPGMAPTYTALGANLFARGRTAEARKHTLRGWMGDFDSLRLANNYLFTSAYDDSAEEMLAAEHIFWAKTLRVSNNSSGRGSFRQDLDSIR